MEEARVESLNYQSPKGEINRSRRFGKRSCIDRSWRFGSACERRKRIAN
jgi:hypothetical protein